MCSQHFMEIMSLVFVKLRDETGFEKPARVEKNRKDLPEETE